MGRAQDFHTLALCLSEFLPESSTLISDSDHPSVVRNSHASFWGAAVEVEIL